MNRKTNCRGVSSVQPPEKSLSSGYTDRPLTLTPDHTIPNTMASCCRVPFEDNARLSKWNESREVQPDFISVSIVLRSTIKGNEILLCLLSLPFGLLYRSTVPACLLRYRSIKKHRQGPHWLDDRCCISR